MKWRRVWEESYMAVNVVAVDNAPELLEKIEGIFRNMDGVNLLGTFEEAVAVVEFVKENPVDMVLRISSCRISAASAWQKNFISWAMLGSVLMSSIPGFSLRRGKSRHMDLSKNRTRNMIS